MVETQFEITRFPSSSNKSLKAWSAADEHMLIAVEELKLETEKACIYNDRFGYLSLNVQATEVYSIITHHSQKSAIDFNASNNDLSSKIAYQYPLDKSENRNDLALIKVPKSLDLFELFLIDAVKQCKDNAVVICGFMTRHFTPQMITIAERYFDNVVQSKAWKKSRTLHLTGPKQNENRTPINVIKYKTLEEKEAQLQQYYGVFSANHIDYATQFLLEHLPQIKDDSIIMDLACGSGIIGKSVLERNPNIELHLLDDSFLAIESCKLNIHNEGVNYHFANNLDAIPKQNFDLVLCNPPFHFEHENTIEIALSLFKGARRIMKEDGMFICVANQHLNYYTHLTQYFSNIEKIGNSKFIVYRCKR